MTHEELIAFRDKVALPKLLELFENTQIPDGACYIDKVAINLLDGRSCGCETQYRASGYQYKDGQVTKYEFDETDIDLGAFCEVHKDCIFVTDGKLIVSDELCEMELNTVLRNINVCGKLFPELANIPEMNMAHAPVPYYKMEHLYGNKGDIVNAFTHGLVVDGIWGTWHTVDHMEIDGKTYYLMQHDEYDSNVESIIVDGTGKAILDYVLTGFDEEAIEDIRNEVLTEKLFVDISQQLLEKQNTTAYGEPQAFVALENGRIIEVTLEQEMLPPEKHFYSLRLHCNAAEYDRDEYLDTIGIIRQFVTEGNSLEMLKPLLHSAIWFNANTPVRESNLSQEEKAPLSSIIDDASSRAAGQTQPKPEKGRAPER